MIPPSRSYRIPTTAGAALAAALPRLPAGAPRREAELLLAHAMGASREWALAHPEAELDAGQRQRFRALIDDYGRGTPLPYLLGRWEFFGLSFIVTPAVLIPRPETELLVETALSILRRPSSAGGRHPRLLDAGTGSGIIAVALAVHAPNLNIVATDISAPALEVARANAAAHAVAHRIDFVHGDLLEGAGAVDMICANLPYIPSADLGTLPVARHEPAAALDGGPDGLRLIERLLEAAGRHLRPGGALLAEIAAGQKAAALALARRYFPQASPRVLQDLAGLDRLLVVET